MVTVWVGKNCGGCWWFGLVRLVCYIGVSDLVV